jgi:hypothetical protein
VRCFACGGPYHEASGHAFPGLGIAYCGPCIRHFMAWYRKHTSPRKGPDFYAEAATSNRPR